MKSPLLPIKLRGEDATGNGWFGANRGNRLHEGVDFIGEFKNGGLSRGAAPFDIQTGKDLRD